MPDHARRAQIPFGSFLIPHILTRLPSRHAAALSATTAKTLKSGSFSVNSSKLHTQLIAYTLTGQISGAFIEVGLPYLKAKLMPVVQEKLHHTAAAEEARNKAGANDHDDEKDFLARIREEQLLPTNEIFGEYQEMAQQFGYIVLFAVIWPISPIWSLINNFVRRCEYFTPRRADGTSPTVRDPLRRLQAHIAGKAAHPVQDEQHRSLARRYRA